MDITSSLSFRHWNTLLLVIPYLGAKKTTGTFFPVNVNPMTIKSWVKRVDLTVSNVPLSLQVVADVKIILAGRTQKPDKFLVILFYIMLQNKEVLITSSSFNVRYKHIIQSLRKRRRFQRFHPFTLNHLIEGILL